MTAPRQKTTAHAALIEQMLDHLAGAADDDAMVAASVALGIVTARSARRFGLALDWSAAADKVLETALGMIEPPTDLKEPAP